MSDPNWWRVNIPNTEFTFEDVTRLTPRDFVLLLRSKRHPIEAWEAVRINRRGIPKRDPLAYLNK